MVCFIANLITAGNLFCGLASILYSINEQYLSASWLILTALLLDVVEGRIARLGGEGNNFGKQFDSLSDLVSFGLAPLVLVYVLIYKSLSLATFSILFVYLLSATFRLARFNLRSRQVATLSFFGLPIGAAGGFLASSIIVCQRYGLVPEDLKVSGVFLILLALLMASNIRYPNFNNVRIFRGITVIFLLGISCAFILFPELSLWLIFVGYIAIGPWVLLRKQKMRF